jgi:hypothetical protein
MGDEGYLARTVVSQTPSKLNSIDMVSLNLHSTLNSDMVSSLYIIPKKAS